MNKYLASTLGAAIAACSLSAAAMTPDEVFDLANWKLTLPRDCSGGTAGTACEVKQPALNTYESTWFRVPSTGGAILFRADAQGARTSSATKYARSELRQMNGSSNAAWSCTGKTTSMQMRFAIKHTPINKPEVTVGQIHDASDDLLMIKYTGPSGANGSTDTGKLEARFNDDTTTKLITSSYQLGTEVTFDIQVSGGKVNIIYNGRTVISGQALRSGTCYWKAGMYIQANTSTDSPTAYGEVSMRALTVK
ncbi:polysaccharide lyase family 7 protein [soil metagenome]